MKSSSSTDVTHSRLKSVSSRRCGADVRTTHDFIREIESGKYDDLKDKPVVTYCTGGIRCEILSALMKTADLKKIYQIDGGIVRYGEKVRR